LLHRGTGTGTVAGTPRDVEPREVAVTEQGAAETKSARTRSTIIDAALRLFRERGYDATTMRAIAAEAGVSVGNAYYYFSSKEQLIQGFYDRAQVEHAAASRPVLDGSRDLTARIVGVVEAWLTAMEPYRPFAGKFFKNAAEPTSPLSPFSPESSPARVAAIELWREVLEGSRARVPKRLRDELPEMLWLYFMGIVLLWVHDPTPDGSATRNVVAASAPLVVRAVGLARLPVVNAMLDDVIALISQVRQVFPSPEPPAPAPT
jgi:AcrR family transcriptional regulator